MTAKTYVTRGVGNFGPAHPMHDPSIDLTLYVGEEVFLKRRYSDGYEAHYEALKRGFEPKEEGMKQSSNYKLAALDLGLLTI